VDRWVKNTVMLVVLLVWFVYMIINTIVRGVLPEPALWGVPGGIWLALNPPFIGGRSNNKAQEIEK
jgi:hypothetical protein